MPLAGPRDPDRDQTGQNGQAAHQNTALDQSMGAERQARCHRQEGEPGQGSGHAARQHGADDGGQSPQAQHQRPLGHAITPQQGQTAQARHGHGQNSEEDRSVDPLTQPAPTQRRQGRGHGPSGVPGRDARQIAGLRHGVWTHRRGHVARNPDSASRRGDSREAFQPSAAGERGRGRSRARRLWQTTDLLPGVAGPIPRS